MITAEERARQAKAFNGPITAETSDDDLHSLAYRQGYAAGAPIQIFARLLKLERHVLQLEARLKQ
jgi:hypothetical protein